MMMAIMMMVMIIVMSYFHKLLTELMPTPMTDFCQVSYH